MLRLRHETPPEWVEVVNREPIAFLQDHAANERKVSHSALTLAVQNPDKVDLVAALVPVAREELDHFALVYDLLVARGAALAPDAPDPYMGKMFRALRRHDVAIYLMDRLILFGIVEARGCERFAMLADGWDDPDLRAIYKDLAASEARHHSLYLRLARQYFDPAAVDARLDELLDHEATVHAALAVEPKLH